jgi:hypothetical protein
MPISLLLMPVSTSNFFNNIDFSQVGNSALLDSKAFLKSKNLTRLPNSLNFGELSNLNTFFTKLDSLYSTTSSLDYIPYSYNFERQHNFSSLNSFLPLFSTILDNKSLSKFFTYNLNYNPNSISSKNLALRPFLFSNLNSNPLFSRLNFYPSFSFLNKISQNYITSSFNYKFLDELDRFNFLGNFTSFMFNTSELYKFKDLKSPNHQLTNSEKNIRSLVSNFSSDISFNLSPTRNFSLSSSLESSSFLPIKDFFLKMLFTGLTSTNSLNSFSSTMPHAHDLDYNRSSFFSTAGISPLYASKEDSAPDYVFNSY